MDEHGGPRHYEIRIRGALSDRLLIAFPGLRSHTDGGDTLLAGTLSDQAALHGVLAVIEALHLELLEVRRPAFTAHPDHARTVPQTESVESDDAGSSGSAGGSS